MLSLCTVHLLCVICEPISLCVSLRVAGMFVFCVLGIFHVIYMHYISVCPCFLCVHVYNILTPEENNLLLPEEGLGGCPTGGSA